MVTARFSRFAGAPQGDNNNNNNRMLIAPCAARGANRGFICCRMSFLPPPMLLQHALSCMDYNGASGQPPRTCYLNFGTLDAVAVCGVLAVSRSLLFALLTRTPDAPASNSNRSSMLVSARPTLSWWCAGITSASS